MRCKQGMSPSVVSEISSRCFTKQMAMGACVVYLLFVVHLCVSLFKRKREREKFCVCSPPLTHNEHAHPRASFSLVAPGLASLIRGVMTPSVLSLCSC